MWLITGGAFQGKLSYALNQTDIQAENVIDGSTCEVQELMENPLVNHFHLWIYRMLQDGKDINEVVNQILQRNPNIVIVVDELGCGIIPMEAFDRNYREITGRICCRLAENAKEVHRVICGIGMVLKHA
jgi:adenosyl cobinamide kinase/adenosyl cobinamide phosphate guanylyltransferase